MENEQYMKLAASIGELNKSLRVQHQRMNELEDKMGVQNPPVLDLNLIPSGQTESDESCPKCVKLEIELENERAQMILREQAIRELEADNQDFAEREAKYNEVLSESKESHKQLLTKLYQEIGDHLRAENDKT